MNPLFLLLGALFLMSSKPKAKPATNGGLQGKQTRSYVANVPALRQLITATAKAHGVDPRLALATARVESRFDPQAQGDLDWWQNRARFEKVVPKGSPFRSFPALWHSYGLFQLLAPYHVTAQEDPRILVDPIVNTQRGVATLAALAARYGRDWDSIRLAYTGAMHGTPTERADVLTAWHAALKQEA